MIVGGFFNKFLNADLMIILPFSDFTNLRFFDKMVNEDSGGFEPKWPEF